MRGRKSCCQKNDVIYAELPPSKKVNSEVKKKFNWSSCSIQAMVDLLHDCNAFGVLEYDDGVFDF